MNAITQYPKYTVLTAGVLLAASTLSAQSINADFSGGLGSENPNEYYGSAGEGWADEWKRSSQANLTLTDTVTNTNPFAGGGNYLSLSFSQSGIDNTQRNAAVGRRYDSYGDVNVSQVHYISFDMRIDSWDFTSTNQGSKFVGAFGLVDRESMANNFVGDSTWMIRAYAANSGGATALTWAAFDGSQDGGNFASSDMQTIGSGMEIVLGTTYSFIIENDPVNGQYRVTITDGNNTVTTADWLGYRTDKYGENDTADPWVIFQAQTRMDGDSVQYSIDNLSIAPIPEPGTYAMMFGMAAAGLAFIRHKRTK